MSDEILSTPVPSASTASVDSSPVSSTASQPQSQSSAPADHVESFEAQAEKQRKTFDREYVNRAAAHAAREAEERVRAEYQRNAQVQQAPQQQMQPQRQQELDANAVYRALEQISAEQIARDNISSLQSKVIGSSGKYEDFGVTTGWLGPRTDPRTNEIDPFSGIVNLVTAPIFNSFDNAGDIIYELGKNSEKIPAVLIEAAKRENIGNPNIAYAAREALNKISTQLKANETARAQPVANAPLEHERPSTIGLGNGKPTVSQLRDDPRYRC